MTKTTETSRRVHHDTMKKAHPTVVAMIEAFEQRHAKRASHAPHMPHGLPRGSAGNESTLNTPWYSNTTAAHEHTFDSPGNAYASPQGVLSMMVAYRAHSQQVMRVGPKMQAAFENTSVKGVPVDVFNTPYPCFYVDLPGSSMRVWGGPRTGMHAVAGAYVEYRATTGYLRVYIWGEPNALSMDPLDDASFWFDLKLKDSELDFEEHLMSVLSSPANDHSDPGTEPERMSEDIRAEVCATATAVLRIIVNTCLYVTSSRPDLTRLPSSHRAKIERLKKKMAGARKAKFAKRMEDKIRAVPTATVVWVGKSYETAPSSGLAGGTKKTHWRKGHWHQFRTGKRKAEDGTPIPLDQQPLRLRWVAPVQINAQKGHAGGHVYMVTE